jgi:hypothetical protein
MATDRETLVCKSCEEPAPMLTEEGFCAGCYWKLERGALSARIGAADTVRIDLSHDRRI